MEMLMAEKALTEAEKEKKGIFKEVEEMRERKKVLIGHLQSSDSQFGAILVFNQMPVSHKNAE